MILQQENCHQDKNRYHSDSSPQNKFSEIVPCIFMVFIIHKVYFCLALNLGLVLFITYTLPLLLTSFEFKSLFFIDFSELFIFINFNYAGNVLLFHVLRQSTIGAERLDFRVRNGIGYNTLAIITGQGFISKN